MSFSERYQTPISSIWSSEHRLRCQLRVELALLKALAETGTGNVPMEAYTELKAAVDAGKVTLARVNELEKQTHHDIMAMVMALTEQSPKYGGFVHFGATSQDINDTVSAIQLTESKKMLLQGVDNVKAELHRLAETYKNLACIARTHGQHAIPTTMGFKFANFLYELSVAREYLARAKTEIGKMAGAVGTFASVGSTAVQEATMRELGLECPPITTQVVSRLHMAEYLFSLTAIAAVLEKLCKELRNLQRTEIAEVAEGFVGTQVGSSTMPQKKNPHKSERVCGLARIVRSQLMPQVETVSLEHERDLTNSSVERVTLEVATVVTHYMLLETTKILQGLVVDEAKVKENLHLLQGNQLAERLMIALTDKLPGGRQEAHSLLKKYAHSAEGVKGMIKDPAIKQHFESEAEFEKLLEPETYIGLAPQIVDSVIARFTTTTSH
eukprot:GEZU01017544.1.p2 GENE.GEZU01017544.1~~GEZU01017544.1.p2  ORF type:complete len:441 (-),score=162.52 GEZU01017544.1:2344-3666(-)